MSYQKVTRGFYDGMVQAAHEAKAQLLPLWQERVSRSPQGRDAEAQLGKILYIKKRMLTGPAQVDVEHSVSHFTLQFFAMMSALNMQRLQGHLESYKTDLIQEEFFRLCQQEELEWLGVYTAELVEAEQMTGFAANDWRNGLIKQYQQVLHSRSSLDADTLVASRLFFQALGLGQNVSPAQAEQLSGELNLKANWLKNYLKYNPL